MTYRVELIDTVTLGKIASQRWSYFCDLCSCRHIECFKCGAVIAGDDDQEVAEQFVREYEESGAWGIAERKIYCPACVRKYHHANISPSSY